MANQQEIELVIQDVDTFVAGTGLVDDFDGYIQRIRAAPVKYGKMEHYALGVVVTFAPKQEGEFEPFPQIYSAGNLDFHVPVKENKKPVDLESWDEQDASEVEGVYIGRTTLGKDKNKDLSPTSNWGVFLAALKDGGYPEKHLDLRGYEGIAGRWKRVPPPERKGLEGKQGDILVLMKLDKTSAKASTKTAVTGKSATPTKPAGTASQTSPASDSGVDDSHVAQLIVTAIQKRGDEREVNDVPAKAIAVDKLSSHLVATHNPKVATTEIRNRAKDTDFLAAAEGFFYDADEGIVYIMQED